MGMSVTFEDCIVCNEPAFFIKIEGGYYLCRDCIKEGKDLG